MLRIPTIDRKANRRDVHSFEPFERDWTVANHLNVCYNTFKSLATNCIWPTNNISSARFIWSIHRIKWVWEIRTFDGFYGCYCLKHTGIVTSIYFMNMHSSVARFERQRSITGTLTIWKNISLDTKIKRLYWFLCDSLSLSFSCPSVIWCFCRV